jgi:hypothetical protein
MPFRTLSRALGIEVIKIVLVIAPKLFNCWGIPA